MSALCLRPRLFQDAFRSASKPSFQESGGCSARGAIFVQAVSIPVKISGALRTVSSSAKHAASVFQ